MKTLFHILPFLIVHSVTSMDNLRVAYQWKYLDFEYPSENLKLDAIQGTQEFIPENNLPLGLEVHQDRLFVTVPRWRKGVAASLAFINMTQEPGGSPKLRPYPNWEAHRRYSDSPPQIVSPFRIRADACARLWVLDSGTDDVLGNSNELRPPTLLIYNLQDDQLVRTYEIPEEHRSNVSFFVNIAVEDNDCQDSYAYLADIYTPALVVYSLKENQSWQVRHDYFKMDSLAENMTVVNVNFTWADGLMGLALSGADEEGFSTLYFHPMTGFDEFSVSTKILRDKDVISKWPLPPDVSDKFEKLGTRGPKGQSGPSFLDKKTGVLFYALVHLNAVACWRTTNKLYTMESQGRVFMSNVSMVFPNDIKVDNHDNLWVLSDKLPVFMYEPHNMEMQDDGVNFRILTAKVQDAIRGTACDDKLVLSPKIMDKISSKLNNTIIPGRTQDASSNTSTVTVGNTWILMIALCHIAHLIRSH